MSQAIEPGTYKLVNVKGGTVLDLSGADDRTIIGYEDTGGDNQKWTISSPDEFENQTIYNESKGVFLTIEGEPGDWTPIVGGHEPYAWAIRKDWNNSDVWRVYSPGTGFNFDLADHGNSELGTAIHLWGAWEGENQVWHFVRV